MPWQVLPYNCPINPVHAALLRTGKVLFFSGSGNDPKNIANAPLGAALWDVSNGTFSRPRIPLDSTGEPIDVFCAGQAFRPNGRLLVAGGTVQYDPFFGETATFVFAPTSETWIQVASMNRGRWYPTLVTLGSGRIFALSGLDQSSNLDRNPEIFTGDDWSIFSQSTSPIALYAHLFLLNNGRLFYSGAQFSGNNGVSPRILTIPDRFNQSITEQPISGLENPNFCDQAASLLLPPAQDQKVMIIGGGNGSATTRVNIVDLNAPSPIYTAAPSLNNPRMHHNAVILPDRTVFVCNGSRADEDVAQSLIPAEIYNPQTNTWTQVETPNVRGRVYHSVAVLLPDGSVATAGGNPERGIVEQRLEIYRPAYMSQPRPVIQSAPGFSGYGSTIIIRTPQAENIKWVNITRPMATTHGLDTEQRLVNVPISFRTNNTLTVTIPNNRNLAPPGYYMLSITNNNNVPSVASWIQLG
ncbi:galactose oxidase-like domain-containing protein [Iningainema tapete]|uniref:DUF1929 domain-containing protein n=1 Tax=Iningainema tapete BLCC-T55 TaxID=2748662 RepID=A0A8J7CFY4_9CYAN|nr:galactose oxidase-like domain-containing protein [Iningainema tapete]MBD2775590.1 DUF1929 domain-containing protein [Iningainema tapete BLCC-T55]